MEKLVRKFDRDNMLSLLLDFPEQCKKASQIGEEIEIPAYSNFKNIVFSGMGGSAIGGDIIRSYCTYRLDFPIFVIRNYNLPKFVDENTLFFACSYSGNTEETLVSFYEAIKRRAKIFVISSGGKLIDFANKEKIPFVKIPSGYPPRQALGYFVFTLFSIFKKINILNNLDKELEETILVLEKMRDEKISPKIKRGNIALDIAKIIKDRFPVIYSQIDYLDVVSMRWRAQLAENSKMLSSMHFLPEMNHNEIVGWQFPKKIIDKFFVIFLRDNQESEHIYNRIEITKEILNKKKFTFREIWAEGNSLLTRIFSLIYIGDFLSYYLALLNKIDPTPVEPIIYLKQRLSKNKVKGIQ